MSERSSESPTHPDAPRADEAREDECGLLHPNGVFCDKPRGHVGSHAAYSDSPELCLSWGTLSVDAPRAGGETPDLGLEATRRLLAKIERDYRDSAYACDASSFGSLGATRRRIADDVAQLRAALPSLLERHRDGERDTKLLDWLTASCRDLIHSEGGKWEVIEYPGDPLVEERRAIGSTPREALIVAGALRVAHPYDAISVTPPAASDGTWVDIERIKPNCMPPLFDEKRPPAASPEPTVNSNDR